MSPYLTAIVVEALDPPTLARFWAAALGWQQHAETLVRPTLPETPALLLTPTDRPKTGKNRLHLDLAGSADAADHAAAVRRLRDLGAEPVDIGQGDVSWTVLADPEGNEFCVLPEPGTDGHLVAVCQDAADTAVQRPFWQAATGWSVAEEGDWGVSMRIRSDRHGAWRGPRLVMGPPAAPKDGVNRWRLAVTTEAAPVGDWMVDPRHLDTLHVDPEGNEFHLIGG